MKKNIIKLIVGVFLFSVFASCEDNSLLNQAPYSTTSPENFYKTVSDFKLALNGCYEALNTSIIPGGLSAADGTYARGLFYMLEGCSDNVVVNNSAISCDFEKGTYVSSNQNLDYLWAAYFAGISRCNYLLDKLPNAAITDSLKTQFTGEARFMRAFYYQHLAECFGAVPLNTSPTPVINAPRAPLSDIYNLIITDFDYAYKNLKTTGLNKSSTNKWTAGAYLGMVYNYLASCKRYNVGASLLTQYPLNRFDWVNADTLSIKAATVLNDVVTNSPYKLLPQAQYSYLFREGTKSYQYQECLFLSEWSDGASDRYFGSVTEGFTPCGPLTVGGSYGRHLPTNDLYKAYQILADGKTSGDIRRDWNITGRVAATSLKETVDGKDYYIPNAAIPITSGLQWTTGKFRIAVPGTYPNHTQNDCSLNFPLMRLADVKLQLAEALYFNGNENAARSILTEIRTRVVNTSKTSLAALEAAYYKADFVQELLDERRRELCFECKRRVDLIRFAQTTSVIQNMIVEGNTDVKTGIGTLKSNWSDYKIWFPIPQIELDLNSNLVQNAGY